MRKHVPAGQPATKVKPVGNPTKQTRYAQYKRLCSLKSVARFTPFQLF